MNFDQYALDYDAHLQRGVSLSGETSDWFVRERLAHVARCFAADGFAPRQIVDFGCGTGNNLLEIARRWPEAELVGLDPSEASLERARERLAGAAELTTPDRYGVCGQTDWIFSNGVMHHIPRDSQASALAYLRTLLRPAGRLTIFENNPLNPGAHMVMHRIPFDRDAKMLSPWRLSQLFHHAGFEQVRRSYHFLYPNALRFMRFSEPALLQLPIGAQYGVQGERPDD